MKFTNKAVAFLMRSVRGQEFSYQLFKSIANCAPEGLARSLASFFVNGRTELSVDEVVKGYSDLVVAHLTKSVPEFALRQECYSQEGEDLALMRIFNAKRDGFYVDVGAHHPIRFSNTFLLYRMGWRGINIDATPNSMDEFRRVRPRDINVESLVSSSEKEQTFFLLSEPALNTGVSNLAHQRSGENQRYQIVNTVDLKPRALASILDEYLPPSQKIDVLNVDVEGLDFDVLQSNNWDRYRPAVILAELLPATEATTEDDQQEIAQYLHAKGYRIMSRFFNTVLFRLVE